MKVQAESNMATIHISVLIGNGTLSAKSPKIIVDSRTVMPSIRKFMNVIKSIHKITRYIRIVKKIIAVITGISNLAVITTFISTTLAIIVAMFLNRKFRKLISCIIHRICKAIRRMKKAIANRLLHDLSYGIINYLLHQLGDGYTDIGIVSYCSSSFIVVHATVNEDVIVIILHNHNN